MSRVVAFPAYLLLKIEQFQVDLNKVLGSGADGQVVMATIVDQSLAEDLR